MKLLVVFFQLEVDGVLATRSPPDVRQTVPVAWEEAYRGRALMKSS
ncbi:MAG TPA: hypothetical protein VLT79_11600 [Gemmatimonadales bacterium]|nr:hypothetical protein [Gemmatimonadales bacterium]